VIFDRVMSKKLLILVFFTKLQGWANPEFWPNPKFFCGLFLDMPFGTYQNQAPA